MRILLMALVAAACFEGCQGRSAAPRPEGTRLVYEVEPFDRSLPKGEVLAQVKTTVRNRLDLGGSGWASIELDPAGRLVVVLPSADPEYVLHIRRQLERVGRLEFRLVAPESEQNEARIKEVEEEEKVNLAQPPEFIARPEIERVGGPDGKTVPREKRNRWGNLRTVLQNGPGFVVSGAYLSRVVQTYDEHGKPAVAFSLDAEGATKLAMLTGTNIGRELAILLDDDILERARIQSKISDQGQLTGNFSQEDVRGIVTVLKSGALPAKLKLSSQTGPGGPGACP